MQRVTFISGGLTAMLLVAVLLASCTSSGTQKDSSTSGRGGVAHAVHTARLQAIMAALGRSAKEEWPQEIEDIKAAQDERRKQRCMDEAGRMADGLAEAAAEIPAAIADADFSEADRKAFLDSTSLLEVQAINLSNAASASNIDQVALILNRIKTTCYGCHTQFWEQAGPLPFDE